MPSITRGLRFARAAYSAAVKPAGPPPMMISSRVSFVVTFPPESEILASSINDGSPLILPGGERRLAGGSEHDLPVLDANEAAEQRVLPDEQPRAVARPGVHRLDVGPRAARDPVEQLERRCVGHILMVRSAAAAGCGAYPTRW